MALKLLQPGLRPMGQFDIDDDTAANRTNLTGGELYTLGVSTDGGSEITGPNIGVGVPAAEASLASSLTDSTAGNPVHGYIADEGSKGYGTLFGELIGSNAGKATSQSGAVTIGPRTELASGKVTLHHAPGLYGISATPGGGTGASGGSTDAWGATVSHAVNTPLAASSGKWIAANGAANQDQYHCIFLGAVTDSSLVSTSLAAVGESAVNEYFAVYFVGVTGQMFTVIS